MAGPVCAARGLDVSQANFVRSMAFFVHTHANFVIFDRGYEDKAFLGAFLL